MSNDRNKVQEFLTVATGKTYGGSTVTSTLAKTSFQQLIEKNRKDKLDEYEKILKDQSKGQIIFYGPPGTGKTYIAKMLANKITNAPKIDEWLFRNKETSVITLNLGGIANVTFLPSKSNDDIIGFDTGPGMSLLDEAYLRKFKDGFDNRGQLALKGNVDKKLISKWLDQSYFIQSPPKSTGRDQFGMNWLNKHIKDLDRFNFEDQLATLSFFTPRTVFLGCEKFIKDHNVSKIIVSGGGAHHTCVMKFLKDFFWCLLPFFLMWVVGTSLLFVCALATGWITG